MDQLIIDLLERQAHEFGASVIGRKTKQLEFALSVPLPDGQSPSYRILVKVMGQTITARETHVARLPAFCPERHINRDGTFCLGWANVDKLKVEHEQDAWNWWARITKFLRLQERANNLRHWPDHQTWPHGKAAVHQLHAECIAIRLGQSFVNDLAQNKFTVLRHVDNSNDVILRVLRDGKQVFSICEKLNRVVNPRQRCVCERGFRQQASLLRNCGDHAVVVVELALALWKRQLAEANFWKSLEGTPCCGTMNNCPLATK